MPKKKTLTQKSKSKKAKADKDKSQVKNIVVKTKKESVDQSVKKREELSDMEQQQKPVKYYEAVGRRKTAVARVRMWTKGEKVFLVNNKPISEYFKIPELQQVAEASLNIMKCKDKFRVLAKVRGGGLVAQAEAIRHATARALILFNPDFRKRLRRVGYLTRDPRMRERKKFGLKRARRAPQWQKR